MYRLLSVKGEMDRTTARGGRQSFLSARRGGLCCLVLLYLVLLIVPWALVSRLSRGTLAGVPYSDEQGNIPNDIADGNAAILTAAAVLNQLAALLTIPVLYILLCQCAAVRKRRRQAGGLAPSSTKGDKIWLNSLAWTKGELGRRGAGGILPVPAALLLVLAISVLAIQRGIIGETTLRVARCQDVPACSPESASPIAQDRDIRDICALTNDNFTQSALYSRLVAARTLDRHPYFWGAEYLPLDYWQQEMDAAATDNSSSNSGLYPLPPGHLYGADWFVASVPYSTSTGVLTQQTALRMNTTIVCQPRFDRSSAPACAGANPFAVHYNGTAFSEMDPGQQQHWDVQLCVSGDTTRSPWNVTRGAQSYVEQMEILLNMGLLPNVSFACTANTTIGEFELPNVANGNAPGLKTTEALNGAAPPQSCDAWLEQQQQQPPQQQQAKRGDDPDPYVVDLPKRHLLHDRRQLGDMPSDNFSPSPAQGPLTLAMQAMLGFDSFLSGVARNGSGNGSSSGGGGSSAPSAIATLGTFPDLDGGSVELPLWDYWSTSTADSFALPNGGSPGTVAADFFGRMFNASSADIVADRLRVAALYAAEFMMAPASNGQSGFFAAEPLYASAGAAVRVPVVAGGLPAIAAVSALVGLQALLTLATLAYAAVAPGGRPRPAKSDVAA